MWNNMESGLRSECGIGMILENEIKRMIETTNGHCFHCDDMHTTSTLLSRFIKNCFSASITARHSTSDQLLSVFISNESVDVSISS